MIKDFFDYDENLIKITKYDVLGKLPDPFTFEDGRKVSSKEDWEERRKEFYKTAVELQYGTIPPKPEVFHIENIYSGKGMNYRITCGTKEKQTSFIMRILMDKDWTEYKNAPVVVDGDGCFPYPYDSEYTNAFLKRGIAYVSFNRCELANDVNDDGRKGPLFDIYPDYTFGCLGAWAWGYMRCVDALEEMGIFDLSTLAFTGHSRGGKTAMLAGVLDERCLIVNPNETNAGSCSCYRIHSEILKEDGYTHPSETLKNIMEVFPQWFGPELAEYKEKENELPFDCHFLKALVAPRILLVGEAASDAWTNVPGTWQTSMAAMEVFKFLGCEDNFKWYFRKGYHMHHPVDGEMLANLIMSVRGKEELYKDFYYKTPFKQMEKIWDWTVPGK